MRCSYGKAALEAEAIDAWRKRQKMPSAERGVMVQLILRDLKAAIRPPVLKA